MRSAERRALDDVDMVGAVTEPSSQRAGPDNVAVGAQATYDAIAREYHAKIGSELDGKPIDRALLDGFLEMAGSGVIADVGCGPGHVTRYLAARHPDVVGVDLSPGMVAVAREHAPELDFVAASMLELPVPGAAWAGAIALYSIIHFTPEDRAVACRELARVLRPGGLLLVAFHIDSPDFAAGTVNHLTTWFGEAIDIDTYFLEPEDVVADIEAAGFNVMATLIRQCIPDIEYPSRRCYLIAERLAHLVDRGTAQ